jgi:uncharacterized protein (DUF1800 family)
MSADKKVHHLLWRSGFGPDPGTVYVDYQSVLLKLFQSTPYQDITFPGWTPLSVAQIRAMSEPDRKEYQRKERQARLQLSALWFDKMVAAPNPFPEKMAFFWSGHFACRINSAQMGIGYINSLRKYALATFGELLHQMIRNAALLQFLNNNQNRKGNPNENFAREFFELFTLGRGNYSEQDVKEAARALTGWGFERDGSFVFRKNFHDDGQKVIFGKRGAFTGEDLVDLVLKRKECATFIAYKLCKNFQSDSPDISLINLVADELYRTNYNLTAAMKTLFQSQQFQSTESIGSRIKSPVELLAGMSRLFHIRFEKQNALLQMQRAMGQVPLNPPNVAGWPDGRAWIDSSTLMYRLRLPEVLLMDADTILDAKAEFDAQAAQPSVARRVRTTFDVTRLNKLADNTKQEKLSVVLAGELLQVTPSPAAMSLVESFSNAPDRNTQAFKTAIRLMSLPEYQIC